jgi:anti-sigma factor RsiW
MAEPRDDDRLEADLVLLVDGRLDPDRAVALEARPELTERIELVRAGRDRLRAAAASVEAPFELRRQIDALAAHPRGRRRFEALGEQRRRWRPLAALAGVGAAAAVALVLVTAGGAPSVGDVLDSAGRAPTAAISPGGGPLLPVDVEGVRFPNYEEKFGWRAVGRRTDDIDGRAVTTVFYERGRERVSYSIVAGEALSEPDGEDLEAEGTRLRRIGDGNAVTWRRQGHTCVMDGSSAVGLGIVAELAGWKAKGEVPF